VSYRLKRSQPVAREIRRIADTQIRLAISELSATEGRSDAVIHDARRHVKKARAAVRLLRGSLGKDYIAANERLRTVNHMLAPIADGEAVLETLGRIARRYRQTVGRQALGAIRVGLIENERRVGRQATVDRSLETAVRLLRAERQELRNWSTTGAGFGAIRSGLRRSFRAARNGLARVGSRPTPEHFHGWRRRVKDHWLQLRLLEARCGNQLSADRRRLEALDGFLGEYHNCAILDEIVAERRLLPRKEASGWRRALGEYQTQLRRAALASARAVYAETPRQYVGRVKSLWKKTREKRRGASRTRR
jgi:hypothetical protein